MNSSDGAGHMIDMEPSKSTSIANRAVGPLRIAIVTSIHRDFDARLWKYALSLVKMGFGVTLICPCVFPTARGLKAFTFARSRVLLAAQNDRRFQPSLPAPVSGAEQTRIVHFHDLDILPWMTMLAPFKHVVYDVHENYPLEMMHREWIPNLIRRPLAFGVRWGQLFCSQLIRNLVLVAESQEEDFFGPALNKQYIRNYASVALRKHVRADHLSRPPSVIFTGSQTQNNGSFLYLDIASIVHKRRSDVLFFAIDRFDQNESVRTQVHQRVRSRGLEGSYVLLPHVTPQNIMDNLNRAAIAISPNMRVSQQINGIHTKLFEYMAAGLLP